MEDGVKTDVLEASGSLNFTQVATVALTQGENSAARPKHSFPIMGERRSWRMHIDSDGFSPRGIDLAAQHRRPANRHHHAGQKRQPHVAPRGSHKAGSNHHPKAYYLAAAATIRRTPYHQRRATCHWHRAHEGGMARMAMPRRRFGVADTLHDAVQSYALRENSRWRSKTRRFALQRSGLPHRSF